MKWCKEGNAVAAAVGWDGTVSGLGDWITDCPPSLMRASADAFLSRRAP